jgi:general secretion pathway protein J
MKLRHQEQGFTLIEVLVSLVLLSVLTAYAVTAVSSIKRTQAIENRIVARSETDAVRHHLQQTLSDMRVVFEARKDGATELAFDGAENQLSFITVLDDRTVKGGLYRVTYHLSENGDLAMRYSMFRPDQKESETSEISLLQGVKGLKFAYLDDRGGKRTWVPTWQGQAELPGGVLVQIEFTGNYREWNELIVANR